MMKHDAGQGENQPQQEVSSGLLADKAFPLHRFAIRSNRAKSGASREWGFHHFMSASDGFRYP
jgi:hypothetical protein